MSLRRRIPLNSLPRDSRFACANEFRDALTRQLESRFPRDQGHEHTIIWGTAVCARDDKLPAEVLERCRRMEYTVSRGKWWGFRLIFEPRDREFESLKVVAKPSVSAADSARGIVIGIVAALAVLGGLTAAISRFIYGGKPVLMGFISAAAIFVIGCFVSLVLLQPLFQIFAYRLRKDLAVLGGTVECAWQETRMKASLPVLPVISEWSPALKALIAMIIAIALGGGCWWAYTAMGAERGLALEITTWIVVPIAGLTAVTALVLATLCLLDVTD